MTNIRWYRQHVHGHHNGSAYVPYHHNVGLDSINAAGMDETYDTDADDECFDIHDSDDDTDHDTDDDTDHDTNDDTDHDTDDGGRGNLYTIKVPREKLVYLESGSGS